MAGLRSHIYLHIMTNQKNKMSRLRRVKTPWSGRFSEPVSELVQRYTASVDFDRRLADYDIEGSLAHAQMLSAVGIIDTDDLAAIRHGLSQIRDEIRSGEFVWRTELEDVHLNIEKRLTDTDRRCRETPAYCALAQRSGRDGYPALFARFD